MKNTAKVSHDTMLRELENLATCLESFRIVLADYSHSNDHFGGSWSSCGFVHYGDTTVDEDG